MYSIREGLELIREFCWQPKLAAGKIYTEEEMSPFYIGCSLPKKLDEMRKVRQRMEKWIVPISSKAEFIQVELHRKNAGPGTDGRKRKGNAGGGPV